MQVLGYYWGKTPLNKRRPGEGYNISRYRQQETREGRWERKGRNEKVGKGRQEEDKRKVT